MAGSLADLAVLPDAAVAADGFVRIREAAEFVGVSERTIREWMKRKPGLPYSRQGSLLLIPRRALIEFLSAGLVRRDRLTARNGAA